jgi:hypothetical protein
VNVHPHYRIAQKGLLPYDFAKEKSDFKIIALPAKAEAIHALHFQKLKCHVT